MPESKYKNRHIWPNIPKFPNKHCTSLPINQNARFFLDLFLCRRPDILRISIVSPPCSVSPHIPSVYILHHIRSIVQCIEATEKHWIPSIYYVAVKQPKLKKKSPKWRGSQLCMPGNTFRIDCIYYTVSKTAHKHTIYPILIASFFVIMFSSYYVRWKPNKI